MSDYRHELVPGDAALQLLSTSKDEGARRLYLFSKRCIDLAFTAAALPIALPVIAGAAFLIRMEGGCVFYSQERVGKDGATFRMWKLRSMRPNADEALKAYLEANPAARVEWEVKQKLRHDPRITWVGRFIRKYSIDELPQLLNVLTGDMTLVGPRPFLPEQRQQYPGAAYYSMRPGLTGLWQISERNGCTFAERAMHDTRYAAIMSLATDVKIMLKTVSVIFRGTGL
jgi:exopolysaccharide production protein ExoY